MSTLSRDQVPTGEWVSESMESTFALGKLVGSTLKGGEVLLLDGPLGAGKTVFAKGLASSLEIDPMEVTSPSFTLVNHHKGRLTLYHLDLYRLEAGVPAAYAVDLEELLDDHNAVIIIEWAERLEGYSLKTASWHVFIEGDGEDPRRISIKAVTGDK